CSENSLFFIISYLSILKSGCVAVLLNNRIGEDDFREIWNETEAAALFVQQKFKDKFPYDNIYTEEDINNIITDNQGLNDSTLSNDIAIIVYTSGSTGEQKGVMLSHSNIISNTNSIIEYLKLTSDDRMEVTLPFYYCYGTSLLHTHLRVGGSLVLNKSIFLGSVLKEINEYKCTGFAGVPSTFQILLKKTKFTNTTFPSLRYITQAGGKLPNNFILEVADSLPVDFYVMYGATEATARLSYLPPNLIRKKVGSIGKGIPGVKLEVLDENNIQVMPGENGEIVASGGNIMLGYFKDPIETSNVLKNGKYYTGDLATIDEDGYIYIVGRKKHFIKSAGYRISPNEIESKILELPEINECVVFGVPEDLMGEAIVAIVESRNVGIRDKILSHCNSLPSYKIPQIVKVVEKIPLNTSCKKDIPKMKEMILNEREQ
ncbi:MAG: AMP-binding protein, partial [Thermodesulfobacteriota bacterium]